MLPFVSPPWKQAAAIALKKKKNQKLNVEIGLVS